MSRKNIENPGFGQRSEDEREPIVPVTNPRRDVQAQISGVLEQALQRTDLNGMAIDEIMAKVKIDLAPAGKPGDFGFACFPIAQITGQSPAEVARDLAAMMPVPEGGYIDHFEAVGPYVNAFLDYERFGTDLVANILNNRDAYGSENIGQGLHIVVDMSSPNIAKRMSIGHLRSTIIGDSIARIYDKLGYRVTKDNHLGDWGTQYGLLMYAIELWVDDVASLTVGKLQELYVDINNVADPKNKVYEGVDPVEAQKRAEVVQKKGRDYFKKLEDGQDQYVRELWQMMVNWSLEDFQKIYDILGVDFDLTRGESFYEPKLQETLQRVRDSRYIDENGEEQPVAKESEGALIAEMGGDLGTAVIQKSDGATLYMTREIATAINRTDELKADGMIYVVGDDQVGYFRQFFAILERMGFDIAKHSKHVYFGMVKSAEGKFSTRKGNVILLEEVIDRCLKQTEKEFGGRSRLSPEESAIMIRQVAIGALKWTDLMSDPRRSIVFDWDKMLAIDGNSAPYVQYTRARAISVKNEYQRKRIETGDTSKDLTEIPDSINPITDEEKALVKKLADFPDAVARAGEQYNPSVIAGYTFEVAQLFSRLYQKETILGKEDEVITTEEKQTRLAIAMATAQVIENGLDLLGIEAPDKM